MSYDLSWLERLSPATLAQIQQDLSRNSEIEERHAPEGPTILLEDGRRIPGEYTELREKTPVGRRDKGIWTNRDIKRVPIYDNENRCITHVPEDTVSFHLGEEQIGGPPKGAYTRIIKET